MKRTNCNIDTDLLAGAVSPRPPWGGWVVYPEGLVETHRHVVVHVGVVAVPTTGAAVTPRHRHSLLKLVSKYVLNILLLLITYFQLTPQDLWTTGLARLPLPTCWKELPAFITLSSKHLSQPRTNLKGGLHYLKLKSRKKYAAQKYFPNLKFRSKFCSRLEITL